MNAKTNSTTADRLLEMAYDMEQAGRPADAAELRTLARDAGSSWTGAPIERRLEIARLCDAALEQARADRPAYPDGEYRDPIETPLGTVGNVDCTRIETAPDRAWLSFQIGAGTPPLAMIDVDILGGRPGADLLICGVQINADGADEPGMTRAQLEQIRDAIGDLLDDKRLLGALAGQPG